MILVTGASGFVGSWITRQLSQSGHQVRALYNKNPPTEEFLAWPGVSWQQADLLDIYRADEVMQGIREVYNCAAIVSFNPDRRQELVHANTESTANVINAALDAGVRKLIHISSVAALGRDGTTKEITEEAQWEESSLNSGYGLSKYGAEMEVWRGVGEGLEAAILNPGIILGEPLQPSGWKEGSAKLMRIVNEEFPFYTEGVTSFVDIQDVVNTALALMEADITGERFIISEGSHPYRNIFTFMAEDLGKKPPRYRANRFMSNLVWRMAALKSMFTGEAPTLTRETARTAQAKSYYKGDKILTALPAFRYTPIRETISRMALAFQKQLA